MEIKATLKKPYTGKEKADFIVLYNHNLGYEIKETEEALEAWGLTQEEQEEKALENRKNSMRELRNQYLVDYVDPYQLVIRWGTLSEAEQGYLVEYRQYLLDYPNGESWWENEPMTYEEWLVAHHPVVDVESEA
jgi:hypothetical protein